jgi:hypothetical protein
MRGTKPNFLQLPEIPFWKRLLDLSLILLAAPLLLPLMAFIAIMIRATSRGPALFRQERIGYRGRRFVCFKFRTMEVNADTGVHEGHFSQLMRSNVPMKKLDVQDSRVIPGGLMLRALGLDELPQSGGAAALPALRIQGLHSAPPATIRNGTRFDGPVAGQWQEQNDVRADD